MMTRAKKVTIINTEAATMAIGYAIGSYFGRDNKTSTSNDRDVHDSNRMTRNEAPNSPKEKANDREKTTKIAGFKCTPKPIHSR